VGVEVLPVKMRMSQAISSAIAHEMRRDPRVIVLGEDVAEAGGVFKATDGLLSEFGPERVRDTPISEMGFLGAGVGAAMMGLIPVVEIMFMEFLGVALDQLVTQAGQLHYLSNGLLSVPLTVRASAGAGLGFGSQHSQTLERWIMGSPGVKLVVPSGAQSAFALVRAAIRDPNPVVVLEPRVLYSAREDVSLDESFQDAIGRARVLTSGDDITIVSVGSMVPECRSALAGVRAGVDLIDLQCLSPWDKDTVVASVRRTGRLLIVEENPRMLGWGCEIAFEVQAAVFNNLRAPIHRLTAPDTFVPFQKELEARYRPSPADITKACHTLLGMERSNPRQAPELKPDE
jgi:pyruvate/2-oxoglutarate/acetoin dehydrogenase E1 component